MLVAKRCVVSGILLTCSLIFSSASYAGVHFVELPESITDEMMLNQTPELKNDLLDLINEEVQGSVDEIITIIFTRDGQPWYKNLDPALIANLTVESEPAMKDDPPQDNDITFNLTEETGTIPWIPQQEADVLNFLLYVWSDDHQAQGTYNTSKLLYGPPFFDYTVDVFLKPDIEGSAIWIPPTAWYTAPGTITLLNDGELYLKYWRWNDSTYGHNDNDRSVLAKAMLMLFWSGFFTDYDQYMDGLSNSGGTLMMSHFTNAYPNYVEIFHGERPDLNEYRPGFIFYDNYNNEAIATAGYNFGSAGSSEQLAPIRYQMANMAWFKVYTSSAGTGYYKEFSKLMYGYGWYFAQFGPYPGDLYIQPSFQELAKMAEIAWVSDGNSQDVGPEGYHSLNAFDDWRKEQYILTQQKLVPQFGVFSDHNKLKCQIYFPMINNEGDYIEEHPHADIPVKVQIQKPNGTMIYNETHYAESGSGYFEVDIPQLPMLTALVCSCEILGDARQYFDETRKAITTIIKGANQSDFQVMGVLPITWPALRTDSWSIKDPNGIITPLNVTNYAFLFNTLVPNGLEGQYRIYKNGILQDTFGKDKKSFLTNLAWRPEEEFVDNNGNGIPDEYEEELVEKLCPDVYVHDASIIAWPHTAKIMPYYGILCDPYGHYLKPREPYGPDDTTDSDCQDMSDIFEKYKDDWNEDWYLGLTPIPYDDYWNLNKWDTYWYDFYSEHYEFYEEGSGHNMWSGITWNDYNKKVIYYNFSYDEFRPFIQYWFFYPFDDTSLVWGTHEGDWELVNVVISDLNPDLASPGEIVYFFHEHYLPVTFSSPNQFWQIHDGTHPVVRVGGTISGKDDASGGVEMIDEQNYPTNNPWLYCTGASYPRDGYYYNVGGVGTGEVVSSTLDSKHTKYDQFDLVALEPVEGNPPYWTYFPGRWGRTDSIEVKSPYGPTHHGRWRRLYGDPINDTLWNSGYTPPGNGEITIKLHDDKLASKEQIPSLSSKPLATEKSNRSKKKDLTNSNKIGVNAASSATSSLLESPNLTSHNVTLTQNPATTQTTIKLSESLTNGSLAVISIYDISGRLIKRVETDSDYTWDLVSDSGGRVSSGIYIICVQTATQEILEKLAVVK